jgi:hypothetical protein
MMFKGRYSVNAIGHCAKVFNFVLEMECNVKLKTSTRRPLTMEYLQGYSCKAEVKKFDTD